MVSIIIDVENMFHDLKISFFSTKLYYLKLGFFHVV